ncbi:transglutaminase domain-containing protein [Methanohalobium evestigatum]|nr:transglutaminase domain-containing protein [Methanohalobium evestigatum]
MKINQYKKFLSSALVIILLLYYPFMDYYLLEKDNYDRYLKDTCEEILSHSDNNTEKVKNIIKWEQHRIIDNPNVEYFTISNILSLFFINPYRLPDNPGWYLYIGKASCQELAFVFENMAKRTNLTYRRIYADKLIKPNGESNNHRWSEVKLGGKWTIADAGWNGLYHPDYNKSYFINNGYKFGHVVIVDENFKPIKDCTSSYVNKTGHLKIEATKNGKPVENANISIYMMHENSYYQVVGHSIDYSTNSNGIFELDLATYGNTNYIIKLSSTELNGIYQYEGKKSLSLNNNENKILNVKLDEIRPGGSCFYLILGLILIINFYLYIFKGNIMK